VNNTIFGAQSTSFGRKTETDLAASNEEISGGIATRMDRSVAIIACGGGADKEKEKKDGLVGSVA
jgi:hypothetical protein